MEGNCIILIGMAGCGKSTVGRAVAEQLGLAHVDTDWLIESVYGACLQDITDSMSKEEFLDMECSVIASLNLRKSVVSTGGSVIYRESAMKHLKSMGVLVHLDPSLTIIKERIARHPDRGIAIAPGQTIEDLYVEREDLYHKWADWSLQNDGFALEQTVQAVTGWLQLEHKELCVPALIA